VSLCLGVLRAGSGRCGEARCVPLLGELSSVSLRGGEDIVGGRRVGVLSAVEGEAGWDLWLEVRGTRNEKLPEVVIKGFLVGKDGNCRGLPTC